MLRLLIQSLLLSIVVLMFGCAMFEKVLLVPEVNSAVPFDTTLINMDALNAVALAVQDVNVSFWNKDITYLDVLEGTLETGYFRKPNIAGLRLRAQVERNDKLIAITVKGAGPYYSKLSVEEGLQAIQTAITRRLAEAVQAKKPGRVSLLSEAR